MVSVESEPPPPSPSAGVSSHSTLCAHWVSTSAALSRTTLVVLARRLSSVTAAVTPLAAMASNSFAPAFPLHARTVVSITWAEECETRCSKGTRHAGEGPAQICCRSQRAARSSKRAARSSRHTWSTSSNSPSSVDRCTRSRNSRAMSLHVLRFGAPVSAPRLSKQPRSCRRNGGWDAAEDEGTTRLCSSVDRMSVPSISSALRLSTPSSPGGVHSCGCVRAAGGQTGALQLCHAPAQPAGPPGRRWAGRWRTS